MAKSKKKKAKELEVKYVWVIAYINRDFIKIVEEELKKYKYNIQTYIPTVRVVKKKFKQKNMFEFVPLLFNYGFFRITFSDACNPEYLMLLRNRITCISGWVKDPANQVKSSSLRIGKEAGNGIPTSALAKDEEIASLIKTSEEINIYSADELARFNKGDFITMKGYPFENMPAEILEINHSKKNIKVKLLLENLLTKEMTVSFENVFYTVYQGHDDSLSNHQSLEEMESYKSGKVDKLMFDTKYYE